MVSSWIDGGKDPSFEGFQRHLQRVEDYLWVAEDGMKMQGYNGSQCWDTSFTVQVGVHPLRCRRKLLSKQKQRPDALTRSTLDFRLVLWL